MMIKHPTVRLAHRPAQRGLALIVALIILAGVMLISLAGVNTSTMELRMAMNEEAKADTFQTALAALDFVIADSTNLPATGPLFQKKFVDFTSTGAPFKASDVASAARIEDCAPPPRARLATSLTAFSAFEYEVSSNIDRNQMGRAEMAQGYILLGPKC